MRIFGSDFDGHFSFSLVFSYAVSIRSYMIFMVQVLNINCGSYFGHIFAHVVPVQTKLLRKSSVSEENAPEN